MYNQKTSPTLNRGKGSGIMEGMVVSPTTPRDKDGTFWGYAARLASLINVIFAECPYEGGVGPEGGNERAGQRFH
jgi:hypothetical protein